MSYVFTLIIHFYHEIGDILENNRCFLQQGRNIGFSSKLKQNKIKAGLFVDFQPDFSPQHTIKLHSQYIFGVCIIIILERKACFVICKKKHVTVSVLCMIKVGQQLLNSFAFVAQIGVIDRGMSLIAVVKSEC